MNDSAVADVLDLLSARPALPGGGRLLCIDGPAGSGKTTLAENVLEACPDDGLVLHMDDLYEGWGGLDAALGPRVAAQVGEPFAAGRHGSYRRFDWERDEFAELHDVPPVALLVLEGVGSGAVELAAYRTALVWVEAPDDLRIPRGMSRDRTLYERQGQPWDEASQRTRWDGFVRDERRYFAANNLPGAADLWIDGTRPVS